MRREAKVDASTRKSIEFVVPGPPVEWRRARKRGKQHYTDPEMAAHKQRIWYEARRQVSVSGGLQGPIAGEILFVMPRKARQRKGREWYVGRSDLDNLAKLVLDACENEVWEGSDAWVVDLRVRAVRAALDEEPRTICEFWVAPPVDGALS